jgi:hypothetical protein
MCFSCHECDYNICSQCYNNSYKNYSQGNFIFNHIPPNMILKDRLSHETSAGNVEWIHNSMFYQPPSQYFKACCNGHYLSSSSGESTKYPTCRRYGKIKMINCYSCNLCNYDICVEYYSKSE